MRSPIASQASMTTSYDTAKTVLQRAPEAQGLYISCPQWPVIDQIEPIERDFGIPSSRI